MKPTNETTMDVPQDVVVADLVNLLDENLREEFEERAAIIEFDANLPRGHAECLALLDVLHRYPRVLTGVTALQFKLNGAPQRLLTTDLALAGQHLAYIGGTEIGPFDLAEVVEEEYGGLAMLLTVS